MWFTGNFIAGMPDVPGVALGLFRVTLGLAFVWKVCWELRWGALHHLDRGSLIRWRYEHGDSPVKLIPHPVVFRVFHLLRAVAAACLLLGIGTPVAAAALALWCWYEFTFDRKSSHAFLGVCSALLVLSGAADQYLTLSDLLTAGSIGDFLTPAAAAVPTADPWPQILLILAAIHLYWSSAWHKMRSPQFMSGDALQKAFEQLATIRYELPRMHREYWFPEWFNRHFAIGDPQAVRRRWKGPAVTVVAVEALLPLLLLIPQTWLVAVLAGLTMHAIFTMLMPKRLMPFTLATVGTYPLFLDPVLVSQWIMG